MSETWEKWADIDKPLFLSVYILNITNKETINVDGFPKFKEVGPYSYRQRRRKRNFSLEDGESLVSYEQETIYYFDQEASAPGLTEDDNVNILNIPFYVS